MRKIKVKVILLNTPVSIISDIMYIKICALVFPFTEFLNLVIHFTIRVTGNKSIDPYYRICYLMAKGWV